MGPSVPSDRPARRAVTAMGRSADRGTGHRGRPWRCVEALEAGVTQLDLELTRTVADHVAEIATRRYTRAFRVLAALAWGLLLVALTALVVR